mgnify:CR=1 FL=1
MLKKENQMEEALTDKIVNFSSNYKRKTWKVKFEDNLKHKFEV